MHTPPGEQMSSPAIIQREEVPLGPQAHGQVLEAPAGRTMAVWLDRHSLSLSVGGVTSGVSSPGLSSQAET